MIYYKNISPCLTTCPLFWGGNAFQLSLRFYDSVSELLKVFQKILTKPGCVLLLGYCRRFILKAILCGAFSISGGMEKDLNTNTHTYSTQKKEIHVFCLLNLLIDHNVFSCSPVKENHISHLSPVWEVSIASAF